MRIAVIQHVSYEPDGSIAAWAAARGHRRVVYPLFERDELPAIEAFDLLVVMGGPMSVHDEERYPWLAAEKSLIRAALDARRRVLGICLGAQLIAEALGGTVMQNPHPEIGWFPVETVPWQLPARFGLPAKFDAFHWHGETFTLPAGAIHLARSAGCLHQAFSLGPRVLAVQFHPEATAQTVELLATHAAREIGTGPWEQPASGLQRDEQTFRTLRSICFTVIDHMVGEPGPALE